MKFDFKLFTRSFVHSSCGAAFLPDEVAAVTFVLVLDVGRQATCPGIVLMAMTIVLVLFVGANGTSPGIVQMAVAVAVEAVATEYATARASNAVKGTGPATVQIVEDMMSQNAQKENVQWAIR